jgi:hypothetical protein
VRKVLEEFVTSPLQDLATAQRAAGAPLNPKHLLVLLTPLTRLRMCENMLLGLGRRPTTSHLDFVQRA